MVPVGCPASRASQTLRKPRVAAGCNSAQLDLRPAVNHHHHHHHHLPTSTTTATAMLRCLLYLHRRLHKRHQRITMPLRARTPSLHPAPKQTHSGESGELERACVWGPARGSSPVRGCRQRPACGKRVATPLQRKAALHPPPSPGGRRPVGGYCLKGTHSMNESNARLNTSDSSQHRRQKLTCAAALATRQPGEQYTAAWQVSHRGAAPPSDATFAPHVVQLP
jgi:hypothetical protein